MARTVLQIVASDPASGNQVEVVDTAERGGEESTRVKLGQEEAALSEAIVKLIVDRRWELLNPNSGDSVAVGGHHVCVGYEEDNVTGYRTWEWHGHVLVYDAGCGYVPEYIYGNFFEHLHRSTRSFSIDLLSDLARFSTELRSEPSEETTPRVWNI